MRLVQTRKDMLEHNELFQKCADLAADDKTKAAMLAHIWDEATVIAHNVDWLLSRFYVPDEEVGCCVKDGIAQRLAPGVKNEAINWGDLGVMDVRRLGEDGWLVDIEEANPDCPVLCGYISGWLRKWGWEVEVRTEW